MRTIGVNAPKIALFVLLSLFLVSGFSAVSASVNQTIFTSTKPLTSLWSSVRNFSLTSVSRATYDLSHDLPEVARSFGNLGHPLVSSIPTDLASGLVPLETLPNLELTVLLASKQEELVDNQSRLQKSRCSFLSKISYIAAKECDSNVLALFAVNYPSADKLRILHARNREIGVAGTNIGLVGGMNPSTIIPPFEIPKISFIGEPDKSKKLFSLHLPRLVEVTLLPLQVGEKYVSFTLGTGLASAAEELSTTRTTLPLVDRFSLSLYCSLASFSSSIDTSRCDYDAVAEGRVGTQPAGDSEQLAVNTRTSDQQSVNNNLDSDPLPTGNWSLATGEVGAAKTFDKTQPSPIYITKYITEYVGIPGPAGSDGRDGKDGKDGNNGLTVSNTQIQPSYSGFIYPTTPTTPIGISTISYLKDTTIDTPTINSGSATNFSLSAPTLTNAVFNGLSLFNNTANFTGTVAVNNFTATSSSFLDAALTNSTTTNAFVTNLFTTAATSTDSYITRLVAASSTLTDAMLTNSTTTNAYVASLVAASSTLTDILGTNAVITNAAFANSTTTNAYVASLVAASSTLTDILGTNAVITNAAFANSTTTRAYVESLTIGTSTAGALTLNGDLTVNGTSTLATTTATSLVATNATTTSLFSSLLEAVTSIITDLTTTNATTTNLFTMNSVLTNSTTTNAYIQNLRIGNQEAGDAVFTNATTTNLFTQNLSVGNASIQGNQTVDGAFRVTGTSTLGANVFLNGNVVMGASSNEMFTVNALVNSNFVPAQNKVYDMGSPSFYWRTVYSDTINVNTLAAASTTISGTSNNEFTINSDNNTGDTEDSNLIFMRGLVTPNALLRWNSTTKRLESNMSFRIQNETPSTGTTTLTVQAGAGQTATNLFELLSYAGSKLSVFNANGWLGLGSSTPGSMLTVVGTSTLATTTINGVLTVNGNTNINQGGTLTVGDKVIAPGEIGAGTSSPSGKISIQNTLTDQVAFLIYGSSTQNAPLIDVFDYPGSNQSIFRVSPTGLITGKQINISGTSTFATVGGNVGIGTTTPGSLLSVQGDAYFGGNVTATGTLNVSGKTTFTNASGTALTVNDLYATNATFGTTTFVQTNMTNASSTNFTAVNATTTNLVATNATTTNLFTTLLTAVTGFFTDLTTTNFTATNATSTNLFATAFRAVTGTVNTLTGGNITATSSLTSNGTLNVTGQTTLGNASTTNLSVSGNSYFGNNDGIWNSSGNVGIGTTTPAGKLDIYSSSVSARLLQLDSDGSLGIAFDNAGVNNNRVVMRGYNGSTLTTMIDPASASYFTGGNVGIGTTSPSALMHLSSTAAQDLFRVDDNGAGDTSPFVINSAGNVGIGTTTPSKGLDIDGVTNTGGMRLSGNQANVGLTLNNYGAGGIPWTISSSGAGHADGNGSLLFSNNFASGAKVAFGSNGNVGIGTTSPQSGIGLTIEGTAAKASIALNRTDSGGKIWRLSSGLPEGGAPQSFSIHDTTVGSSRFVIDTNGNVGIGTSSPTARLSLTTSSYSLNTLRAYDAGGNIGMAVDGYGRTGLGTATPASRLSVVGDVNIQTTAGANSVNYPGLRVQSLPDANSTFTDFQGNTRKSATLNLVSIGAISGRPILNVSNGSAEGLLYVDGSGNVGIGTTGPLDTLHIKTNETGAGTSLLRLDNSGTLGNEVGIDLYSSTLDSTGPNRAGRIYGEFDGTSFVDARLSLQSMTSGGVLVDTLHLKNGNVGIGTTTPGAVLDVLKNIGSDTPGTNLVQALRMSGLQGFGYRFSGDTNKLIMDRLYGGVWSEMMSYDRTNGNVGIGTTSPSALMHLSSTAAQDLFRVDDNGAGDTSPFVINSAGNVGIGTTTPDAKLMVSTSDSTQLRLHRDSNTVGTATNLIFALDDSLGNPTNYASIQTLIVANNDGAEKGKLSFNTAASGGVLTQRMVIDDTGNVGIGTTSPLYRLSVTGASTSDGIVLERANIERIKLLADGTLYWGASADQGRLSWAANDTQINALTGNRLSFGSNGTQNRMVLDTSGNVGIGTTTPLAKLDVRGDALIEDNATGLPALSVHGYGTGNTTNAGSLLVLSTDEQSWRINNSYQAGNNKDLVFRDQTNGVNVMTLRPSTGNVGIGTTTPFAALTTVGDGYFSGGLGVGTAPITSGGVTINRAGADPFVALLSNNIQYGQVRANSTNNIIGFSNSSGNFQLAVNTSSGYVGIGTTTPETALDVVGSITSSAIVKSGTYFSANNVGYIRGDSAGSLRIQGGSTNTEFRNNANSATLMTILNGGNIGIGITGPTYKFQISGTAGAEGVARIGSIDYGTTTVLSIAPGSVYFDAPGVVGGRMTINGSTGNVGIGTTSPIGTLEISKSSDPSLYLSRPGLGSSYGAVGTGIVYFRDSDNAQNTAAVQAVGYMPGNNGDLTFKTLAAGVLAEKMRIKSDGNVGIGTTAPVVRTVMSAPWLTISSAAPGLALIESDAINPNTKFFALNGQKLLIGQMNSDGTSPTDQMVIDRSGNVGIGTTTPAARLDVQGDANFGNGDASPTVTVGNFNNVANDATLYLRTSGNAILQSANGGTFAFRNASASEFLTINTATGNVGIGTTTPSGKLAVSGGASIGADYNFAPPTNGLIIQGNVGIGTTTPSSKLTISDTGNDFLALDRTAGSIGTWFIGNASGGFAIDTTSIASTTATKKFIITSAGNVGIGTTTPGGKLSVIDGNLNIYTTSASSYSALRLGVDANALTGGALYHLNASYSGTGVVTPNTTALVGYESGGLTIGAQHSSTGNIRFYTAGPAASNERMRIDTTGNVGIGTTTPGAMLDVEGTARINKLEIDTLADGIVFNQTTNAKAIRMSGRNMGLTFNNTGAYLSLTDQNSNEAVVVKSGAVGVFNTNPGEALDVTGNIKASGVLTVSGTTTSSIAGNLGIGTTGPSTTLDVVGNASSAATSIMSISNSNGTGRYAGLKFRGITTSGGGPFDSGRIVSGFIDGAGFANAGITLQTPTAADTWVDVLTAKNGNVGIGTSTPQAKLHVNGNILLPNNTALQWYTNAGVIRDVLKLSSADTLDLTSIGTLQFNNGNRIVQNSPVSYAETIFTGPSNIAAMTWGADGNVGIGTTSPSALMHLSSTAAQDLFRVDDNGAGDTSPFVINSAGNVGIGTTSPVRKLHVYNGEISIDRTTVSQWNQLYFATAGTEAWSIGNRNASSDFTIRDIGANTYSLVIQQSTGNVGIGTTSPATKLQVYDATTGTSLSVRNAIGNGNGATLTVGASRGTAASPTDVVNGDNIGSFLTEAYSGGTWFNTAGMYSIVDGTFTSGQRPPSALVFNSNSANGALTEVMRITSAGNVGIGTTSPFYKLSIRPANNNADGLTFDQTAGYPASIIYEGTGGSPSGWGLTFKMPTGASTQTSVLALRGNGNVGIGTSTPGAKLAIESNTGTGWLKLTTTSGNPYIESANALFLKAAGSYGYFSDGTHASLANVSAGTGYGVLNVLNSGNVGIGTTSPDEKLHIEGNLLVDAYNNGGAGNGIFFRESFTSGDANPNNLAIRLTTTPDTNTAPDALEFDAFDGFNFVTNNGANALTILKSGNVGIGTTSPSVKLQVMGGDFGLESTKRFGSGVNFGTPTSAADGYINFYSGTDGSMTLTTTYAGSAAGGMNFQTGGTVTNMRIDKSGNVGIGTTGPQHKLDVSGAINSTELRLVRLSSSLSLPVMKFSDTLAGSVSDNLSIGNAGGGAVILHTNGNERMRISSSGNVGIGTTTPGSKLVVEGTDVTPLILSRTDSSQNTNIQFRNTAGSVYAGANGTSFGIGTNANLNSSPWLYITNGNVGIGTTSPTYKLDILQSENATGGRISYPSGSAALHFLSNIASSGDIYFGDSDSATAGSIRYFHSDDSMRFYTNGATARMALDSNGNLGVGTTSPAVKLHVNEAFGVAGSYGLRVSNTGVTSAYGEFTVDSANGVIKLLASGSSYPMAFNVNGSEQMRVTTAGNIGIGTSTPGSKLDVWSTTSSSNVDIFRIASSVGSANNIKFRIDSDGDVFTDGGTTIGSPADVAESYSALEAVDAGTVVAFGSTTIAWSATEGSATSTASSSDIYEIAGVRKAVDGYEAVGVVSTRPGLHLGADIQNGVPVALSGRVPVKVTTENGPVLRGDYLTVSPTRPGYAMKLTGEGRSIGRALSNYQEGRDKVMMIVENGFQKLDTAGRYATTTGMLTTGNIDLNANGVAIYNIKSLASANGTWSIDENGRITAKMLCLEDVCIDKAQLSNMLNSTGQVGTVISDQSSVSGSTDTGMVAGTSTSAVTSDTSTVTSTSTSTDTGSGQSPVTSGTASTTTADPSTTTITDITTTPTEPEPEPIDTTVIEPLPDPEPVATEPVPIAEPIAEPAA